MQAGSSFGAAQERAQGAAKIVLAVSGSEPFLVVRNFERIAQ
jgi:hypothetical protein